MKHFFVLLFGVLLSCATPGSARLESQNVPLKTLQKTAAESLPVGQKKISPNGREFYSHYFKPKGMVRFWEASKPQDKERYYVTISILGDRRPYSVEVLVVVERLIKTWGESGLVFEEVGTSQSLADEVLNYYRQNLTKGLKDRNFIDDFRVF